GLFLGGFHPGPIFAIAQTVARPSMRALASAIILLSATCFGQGVGPLVVGALNDALKTDFGAQAVRYSLLSTAVTTVLGALLFVVAARWIRGDIKRASWAESGIQRPLEGRNTPKPRRKGTKNRPDETILREPRND